MRQVEVALASQGDTHADRFKFYNASNFFDHRAVPLVDAERIANLTSAFTGVTVESHANTIGAQTLRFAERVAGRLEVAIGLETIHPRAMQHLNKRLDLARFDVAARLLEHHGIDLRVFVLIGAPFVPTEDSVEWTRRTVKYAVERSAAVVSIIPVRGGNGEMERLQSIGAFVPPTLRDLETAVEACAEFSSAVVTADLWDADRLPGCDDCRTARVERLRTWNISGVLLPRVTCSACEGT